jgi:translocation-and-assembly-module (TAM) inner membrane subunit TamB-like protein
VPADTPPDAATGPTSAPPRKRRSHSILRGLAILTAIVVGLLAATLTIDLGPSLRKLAERRGSEYLDRPMHIGKLKVVLHTGQIELDDLVIEGLKPTDRPFLRAKRLYVNLPWWTAFSRELIIQDIDMSDWQMLVEQFPNGRHNFPRVAGPPRKGPPKKPSNFHTTLQSVIARNGRFTYEDHGTPWSVNCPNLTVNVFRGLDTYRGTAQFSRGTVKIQSYEPFAADMQTRFRIDGGVVKLEDINLQSTGASTRVNGYVDLGHWPEMLYNVKSRVDFPTEKDIFFKSTNFTVTGHGDFVGTFHFFKTPAGTTGRELKGTFTSPEAGVNAWRFPNVKGALLWIPSAFRVTNVTTDLYGGRANFDYAIESSPQPGKPSTSIWDAKYADVDLTRLTDFLQLSGIRLAGRASGRNRLEWPMGRWSDKRGSGQITAVMPPGASPLSRVPSQQAIAQADQLPPEQGPFNPHKPLGYVPVAGQIEYVLEPAWISIPKGWAATEKTYVEFTGGRTAWGQRSQIPFHVTSLDWQESDRLLAGIMTAFGAPTSGIEIVGRGQFDGAMYGRFGDPRIEGHFEGDRMRAWSVVWGHATADLVIENAYVNVRNGVITSGESRIDAEGKFSLGYPRKDNGEEINASITLTKRPLVDLRRAFGIEDYRLEGLASGEYHLYGKYLGPDGFGRLQIDDGTVYGETFATATANLRFENAGVRLDAIEIRKKRDVADKGKVTGAAWVGWDGTYSFDADGIKIPVESISTLSFPRAPLSGILNFNATGRGTFQNPRYDVKLNIIDLYAGDEGIGQVTGLLSLRNDMLTMEMEASSKRLSVSGRGRLALTPEMDADMTLRFSDTSLDPYLRFFAPTLSPFTTAVADGTIHAVGELADVDHLLVEASVEQLKLKLFDYPASNDGPIQLALNQHVIEVKRFKLAGEGTALELGGNIDLHNSRLSLDASGDANLGILQAFYRGELRTSGNASLHAQVRGPLSNPVFSGDARISSGRVRYGQLPHSLQDINARLAFDAQTIRVIDASAQLGGGPVHFGGRIGLKGFTLGTLDLTATGEDMHLRYPEGFRSTINAALTLRGDIASPLLGGNVTVVDGVYTQRFEPNVDILSLATAGGANLGAPASESGSLPIRFDVKIQAPALRIENNMARIVSRADLTLNGTYDHPVLFGRADVEHGEIFLEGNRYVVTRGTIDFLNPARIEPFFDIEAETRIVSATVASSATASARTSETYRITVGVSGILGGGKLNFELNSDPPLAPVDIISLMFGQAAAGNLADPELNALRPQYATQSEEQLLKAGLLRVLAGGITGQVSRAVEQSLGIDTVQISPSLGTEADPLAPTARLIVGKRLSSRAYLTFAQALGTATRERVIVLEYDQTDRLGWILTQNGDRTFAVDFRVRRTF